MKYKETIIIGITSAAVIGIILYLTRKIKTSKMLDQIADEGYETAGDVLFPLRGRRQRRFSKDYNDLNRWENGLFY